MITFNLSFRTVRALKHHKNYYEYICKFNLVKSIACRVMTIVPLRAPLSTFYIGEFHFTITPAQILNRKMQHSGEVAMDDKMLARNLPEHDFSFVVEFFSYLFANSLSLL